MLFFFPLPTFALATGGARDLTRSPWVVQTALARWWQGSAPPRGRLGATCPEGLAPPAQSETKATIKEHALTGSSVNVAEAPHRWPSGYQPALQQQPPPLLRAGRWPCHNKSEERCKEALVWARGGRSNRGRQNSAQRAAHSAPPFLTWLTLLAEEEHRAIQASSCLMAEELHRAIQVSSCSQRAIRVRSCSQRAIRVHSCSHRVIQVSSCLHKAIQASLRWVSVSPKMAAPCPQTVM